MDPSAGMTPATRAEAEPARPGFVLVAVLRADGTIAEVNRCAFEFFPDQRGSVLGKPLWNGPWWRGTEERDAVRAALARAAADEFVRIRSSVRTEAGPGWLEVELSLRPVSDTAGLVTWILAEAIGGRQCLRETEGHLHQIAEKVEDVFWIMDPHHGQLRYVNPAFEQVFGRSTADFYAEPGLLADATHPDDRHRVSAVRAGSNSGSYQIEYRVRRPSGKVRWVREKGFPLLDPTDTVQRLIGIVSDITESRDAREELRRLNENLEQRIAERTERLRLMIESSAEGVITIDSHGVILEWNAAAERIFGWSRSEAVGGRLSELIIPQRYRTAHEAGLRRFLACGQSRVLNGTIELSAIRRSGEEFPMELSVWPVHCAEGYLFSAFLRDVTERHRAAEAEKQRSEQALLFRTVLYDLARADKVDFQASLRHILSTAAHTLGLARVMFGRFETVGKDAVLRAEMIYRATHGDIAPASELAAFRMAEYPQYFTALVSNRPVIANDARRDPATAEFRENYLIPEGITSMLDVPVWMDGQVVAVVCHEHIGPPRNWSLEEVGFALSIGNLVALALEAENRTRTEAELREAEADVRKALTREQELNELKSRFIAMASHEFRTPLTAILSSAELLERYATRLPPEEQSSLIVMIKDAVKTMTQMLEEVLFIGKADTGHLPFNPQITDIDTFCEALLKELRAGVGREHRIEFLPEGPANPTNIDPNLLRQILANLLGNAIKFSPKGSQVTLTRTREPDALVFGITDQGVGIPTEDQPNLFSTFHRARNVNHIQGTGLGLAIVKQCLDLHGGEISYDSNIGQGTRFTVKIPLTGDPA